MLSTLKRVLAPARPILLPVWRRVKPFVEGGLFRSPIDPTTPIVATGSPRSGITQQQPIRPLRAPELDVLTRRLPYYRTRRGYLAVACAEARSLIERHRLRTALELGPHLRSIIVGADLMERRPRSDIEAEGAVIVHDATRTPWPVEDRSYDLFVALQVFEHLRDRQHAAFEEVRRVARHAIISLPIDWEMADPSDIHHQISHERALEWFSPVVPTRSVTHFTGRRKRVVYVFEDLPVPAEP